MRCNDFALLVNRKRNASFNNTNKAGLFEPRTKFTRITAPVREPLDVLISERVNAR